MGAVLIGMFGPMLLFGLLALAAAKWGAESRPGFDERPVVDDRPNWWPIVRRLPDDDDEDDEDDGPDDGHAEPVAEEPEVEAERRSLPRRPRVPAPAGA